MTSQSKERIFTVMAVEFFLVLWALFMLSVSLNGQNLVHDMKSHNFEGILNTSWGEVTLVQHGDEVTGSFTFDQGKINGTVMGNTLYADWSKAPTYSGPFDAGMIEITAHPASKEVLARWKYYDAQNWNHNWNGTWMRDENQLETEVEGLCIWVNKKEYEPGEQITVFFDANDQLEIDAWVGIIPTNVPHGLEAVNDNHVLSLRYLFDRKEGSMIFYAPAEEGSYDIRLNDSDEQGLEVNSITIYVKALPMKEDVIFPMM